MNSNIQEIKKSLLELIKIDQRFVATISGDWGIGKTHFYHNLIKEVSKDKSSAYISLFGYDSLDEIKTAILMQISKRTKSINRIQSKVKDIKRLVYKDEDINLSLSGGVFNMALTLLSKNDFKDIIICFDDFERLSNKIDLKDLMGLISQFKEQKDCKIILILNEKELENLSEIEGKKYSEIFSLYKEKIVDYEFKFLPTTEECFNIVNKLIEIEYFDKKDILNYFNGYDIKNIRIMKQAIYHLNNFKFIEEYNLNKEMICIFLKLSLNIYILKITYNLSEEKLEELRLYNNQSMGINFNETKEETPKDKILDVCIENYNQSFINMFALENIEAILQSYIYKHTIDKENLKIYLKNKESNLKDNIGYKLFPDNESKCFNIKE